MNMTEWKKSIYTNPKRSALPIMTHPGLTIIGKKVIDAVSSGEVHFNAIRALDDRYPDSSAAVNCLMDLSVEAECFGSQINFSENDLPTVTGRIVYDEVTVRSLKVPQLNTGRIPHYLNATTMAVKAFHHKPVFAGCIGPFSLAGRLYDISEIMTAVYEEPDTILLLLQKCTSLLRDYITAFKNTGANGVIMAEPAAGLLSADLCDTFSSNFIRTIVSEVQDETFAVMLHNCGNTGQVTQSVISTGAAMLHFGNNVDMVQTLHEVPDDRIVLGNLDPVGVMKMQRPEEVYASTLELLTATRGFPNFVISTGCDTPPGVPFENINAFYQAVRDFNGNLW